MAKIAPTKYVDLYGNVHADRPNFQVGVWPIWEIVPGTWETRVSITTRSQEYTDVEEPKYGYVQGTYEQIVARAHQEYKSYFQTIAIAGGY